MYEKEALLHILVDDQFRAVDEAGKIFPPSHPVYNSISDEMMKCGSRITPKHVHTILNNNRNGLYDAVLKAFSIQANYEKSSFEESFDPDISQVKGSSSEIKERKFRLVIPYENWAGLKPKRKTYGDRRYVTLTVDWSDILAEKIWQQTKIACSFSMKRAKVYVSGAAKCYVKFIGKCTECKASLTGIVTQKPAKKVDVIFNCIISKLCPNFIHKKRRQLKSGLREKIASELLDGGKDARTWRVDEANRLMDFGDDIPPMLFDGPVLRKAKQQELDKRLQLCNTDPVENLYLAKNTSLPESLHIIGKDPFLVIYATPEQLLMYKQAYKQDLNSFLCIDATGGVVKKIKLPNDVKSPHIFLYQCVCVSNLGNFPAFQMLSSKQDASKIRYFLSEILRLGAPIPRTVVSDFGRAILLAVAREFANCRNLKDYMQKCYKVLISDNAGDDLPDCYIRLDVSHFIPTIARWKCLKGKPRKVRQFFLRCLGFAIHIESLERLRALLKSIMVVALSEEIGESPKGDLLDSEIHLRYTTKAIKGLLVDAAKEDEDSADTTNSFSLDVEDSGNWKDWAVDLFNEAHEAASTSKNGTTINAFNIPEAAMEVKQLVPFLVLWTNVMVPHYKYGEKTATSSAVEASFSVLKSSTFKGRLPMRVDKFVLQHIEEINGSLLLASGKCNVISRNINAHSTEASTEAKQHDEVAFQNECINDQSRESLNELENWRGKAETTKKCRKRAHSANGQSPFSDDECKSYDDQINYECIEETVDGSSPYQHASDAQLDQDVIDDILNHHAPLRATKKVKENYLTPCSDWDFLTTSTAVHIPLVKNGNLCGPAKVDTGLVLLRETCAFDSLLQIMANAIAMYEAYKIAITGKTIPLLQLAQNVLTSGTIRCITYNERAKILCKCPLFEKATHTRNINSLNANCNAGHLAETLIIDLPSATKITLCAKCKYKNQRALLTLNINVNLLIFEGIGNLQQAVDDVSEQNTVTCVKCKSVADVSYEYGPHIFIDTSVFTDPHYMKAVNAVQPSFTLDSIPKIVFVGGTSYISGVIAYNPYRHKPNDGHYVAQVFGGLGWYCYDDTKPKRTSTPGETQICTHVLVYVRHS